MTADILKVCAEAARVCETYGEDCKACPVCDNRDHCMIITQLADMGVNELKKAVQVVMEWATAHPRQTMLEVFITSKPGSVQTPDGAFKLCPNHINPSWTNTCTDGKGNCRECWGREV